MSEKVDVLVIGAGTGGYPAAIRAAQLGKSVILVDKGFIGGECLNWGCIPSKAIIQAANFYYKMNNEADKMGIKVGRNSIDMEKLMEWKESIQNNLVNGVKLLLKSNKVKLMLGTAEFLNPNTVEVKLNEGDKEKIEFDSAIIATGATFISLPGFEIDEENILSAKGLLSLKSLPEELILIGGGIIGIELGSAFAKLGSKIKIVELLPQLMTGVDKRSVQIIEKKLKELGAEIYKETKAQKVEKIENKLKLTIETKEGIKEITGDKILLSIGKKASTDKIGLQRTGVKLDNRGFIITDNQLRTNVKNIFAVGDCIGAPFLAYKATKQGIIAAEVIAGISSAQDFVTIPSAIFTDPEIATTGITEEQAKADKLDVNVGRASFAASGRAMAELETNGYVKVISDAKTDALLGVEIVGPHATDLISEATVALEMGATIEELGYAIHPHPTFPEMIMEAAEAIEGKAIHIPNIRRKDKQN